VRDADLIQKWKEESRRQCSYRLKRDGDEAGEAMRPAAAVAYFEKHMAPDLILEKHRAMLSGALAAGISDDGLRARVRDAWEKESRFPVNVSFALLAAFRHMRLHLFRGAGGEWFVSAVQPLPLDPEYTVEVIARILAYLRQHNASTRNDVLRALCSDAEGKGLTRGDVMAPLGWLVEKGHIVEFFDNTLAVPSAGGRVRFAGRKREGRRRTKQRARSPESRTNSRDHATSP